jgi:threonine dehydrogenase-like Zn-dependent dehydrogenase
MFGYSHFTGGFAGGQAEYVRVPYGDVNLLKLPSSVPDEKGLYLSDVICTSWNCVVDTGIEKDDVVAIWGAGPIGQMCADFAFMNGASRVIMIDSNWRLEYVKSKIPKVELLDYSALPRGTSVTSKLKEMAPRGPDVALECVAGEYAKGWAHYFELMLGMETDTSEIVNEMITSVKNYGRCGITGVYVGFVCPVSFKTSECKLMHVDESLQHRVIDGKRRSPYWKWSSPCTYVLGEALQDD